MRLQSLVVDGFRGLDPLRIDSLARVSLVVGRNGAGKTRLVEALRLWCHRGSPEVAFDLAFERDEGVPINFATMDGAKLAELQREAVVSLFSGRPDPVVDGPSLHIGPIGEPESTLTMRAGRYAWFAGGDGRRTAAWVKPSTDANALLAPGRFETLVSSEFIGLGIDLGEGDEWVYPLGQSNVLWPPRSDFRPVACQDVPPGMVPYDRLDRLWDSITLTPAEDDVIAAVRLVFPDAERISLVELPAGAGRRVPKVRLTGTSQPVPLRSLGHGAERLFSLSLMLVASAGGMLLVDEAETGLHHTVLLQLWRLIFQVAARLDVQVVATTHSLDCVTTFQQAARESEADGRLIRLNDRARALGVAEMDEEALAAAVREAIEVR